MKFWVLIKAENGLASLSFKSHKTNNPIRRADGFEE
jgi:hypothetical protein